MMKDPETLKSLRYSFKFFFFFFFLITCSRGQEAKNVWRLTALVASNNNNI